MLGFNAKRRLPGFPFPAREIRALDGGAALRDRFLRERIDNAHEHGIVDVQGGLRFVSHGVQEMVQFQVVGPAVAECELLFDLFVPAGCRNRFALQGLPPVVLVFLLVGVEGLPLLVLGAAVMR